MCFRNHEQPGPQFILTPCTYTGRLCCQNFYTGFLQNLKDRKKRHEISQTRFYRNTNLKAWHLFSGRCFTQCCTWHSCHNSAILAFHCKAATRVSLRFHTKLLLWRNVTVAAALQYLCHGTSYHLACDLEQPRWALKAPWGNGTALSLHVPLQNYSGAQNSK